MDVDEFAAMLEGEGEEFEAKPRVASVASQGDESNTTRGGESGMDADVSIQFDTETGELDGDNIPPHQRSDSFDLYEDQEETQTQLGPTQGSPRRAGSSKVRRDRLGSLQSLTMYM